MKTNLNFTHLMLAGLLMVAGGCGKSESDSSSTSAKPAEKTAQAETATPKPAAPAPAPAAPTPTPAPASTPTPAPVVAAAPPQATPPKVDPATSPPAPASSASAAASGGLAALSQDQVVQGLKDALSKGLQQAVANLGHDGGFLTNLSVKIPMPDKLQKVEQALRAMKQDKLADDFVTTMNHAAEQAVPQAGAVFADALRQMNIQDATTILAGTNDAATQYFRKATETNLYAKFYPIVKQATAAAGVTSAYKNIMDKVNGSQTFGSFGATLSKTLFDKDSLDIDDYVTNKSLDGLFKMVAEEEKQIRQNPVARTTDLLQKVFSAVKQ